MHNKKAGLISSTSYSALYPLIATLTINNFAGAVTSQEKDKAKVERLCNDYTKINFKWTHRSI